MDARTALGRFPVTLALAALVLCGCQSLTPQQKTLLIEGTREYEQRRYDAAIQKLTHVVNDADDEPGRARALYVRGMAYAKSGRRSLAQADLRRCVQLNANVDAIWRAHVVLGTLHFEDGQWEQAAREYREGLTHAPPDEPVADIWFRVAQCHERLGQWFPAREVYERIVSRYPASPLADDATRRLASASSSFSVQCGAFSNSANAESLRQQLQHNGFNAHIRREQRSGQTMSLVMVGNFSSYAEARRELASVQRYIPDAVIWP